MGFSDIFRSNQFKQTTEGQPPNNIDEDDNGSVQGAKTNNNEDNSELLAAVKEKINSQFIEPKKPEPLNMDISIPELKILHYLNYIFDKDNPLPFYLNSYSDVFENLNKNGYFAEPTP